MMALLPTEEDCATGEASGTMVVRGNTKDDASSKRRDFTIRYYGERRECPIENEELIDSSDDDEE